MAFPLSGILYSAFINHIFWFFSRPIEFICSSNHYNEKGEATLRRDCDPDWIQTNGLLLRRQLLYSAELPDRLNKKAAKINFFSLHPNRLRLMDVKIDESWKKN